MPLIDVRKFVARSREDQAFRRSLNLAESKEERERFLLAEGYQFTSRDFEEAILGLKAGCQSQQEALEIEEIKTWWQMLESKE